MQNTIHIPDKASSRLQVLWNKIIAKRLPDKGYFVLLCAMFFLSALASFDFKPDTHFLIAGEIAPSDIVADRSLLYEDAVATEAKFNKARASLPMVYDLTLEPTTYLHTTLNQLFIDINQASTQEAKETLRLRLSQEYREPIGTEALYALTDTALQEKIVTEVLAPLESLLSEGVLPDIRMTLPFHNRGIIIRHVQEDTESLHTSPDQLTDMKSIETKASQLVKNMHLSPAGLHLLTLVLQQHLQPTLIPNYEATRNKLNAIEESIEPVMRRIQKGETVIRQGERVTPEQQLKLQALIDTDTGPFNWQLFFGSFLCSILLSLGLLLSPSGKTASPMQRRDFYFLSSVLVVFALMAKGLHTLGLLLAETLPTFNPESLSFAVPVAGAAAIASLIFSTRRYLVTGLLLAFFCSIMSNGGLGLFLFYFLGAMWSTRLTMRTQSHQDMLISLLPLSLGLCALWLGTSLLQSTTVPTFMAEGVAVLSGGLFSMILTFALAPVIELFFGYTTRFRLMELLNLEQPLLRDLMVNAPGTYHHSFVVSNMVEAAAKTIGAHSLLCKVAALYHDIGKVSKPGYFIENQFQENNPHERLTPSMSALILTSHVKQGVELAQKYRLGSEISAIIRQHHGTNIIQYFYHKALQQKDAIPPQPEDFSYSGPKPQTKEAALVMLADVVEASSRSLDDPTPTQLSAHIDCIIKKIYSAGQLDETDLTFKDLHIIADSFHQVLRGIFHHRISYPGLKLPEKNTNGQLVVQAPPSTASQPITRQTA